MINGSTLLARTRADRALHTAGRGLPGGNVAFSTFRNRSGAIGDLSVVQLAQQNT